VPATVMAPGPPKAIGKGLFSNGFIAMLLTERYVAGRSQNWR
jgi:transposase